MKLIQVQSERLSQVLACIPRKITVTSIELEVIDCGSLEVHITGGSSEFEGSIDNLIYISDTGGVRARVYPDVFVGVSEVTEKGWDIV
jgi:hypothetical protein